MPNFRATDPDGNTYEYAAASVDPAHFAPGWRVEELVEAVAGQDGPPTPPATVYGGRRELSPLEFLRLLTQPERVAIRTGAKQNATIEDYLGLIDKAETVNLDNPDVAGGLTLLEGIGLLAAGRAAEILNG